MDVVDVGDKKKSDFLSKIKKVSKSSARNKSIFKGHPRKVLSRIYDPAVVFYGRG